MAFMGAHPPHLMFTKLIILLIIVGDAVKVNGNSRYSQEMCGKKLHASHLAACI
jgi:hypothetical protein